MMKRIIYIIIGIAMCVSTSAARLSDDVRAQSTDSITICRLLAEAKHLPATTCLPLHFAQKFIGIPYVASTLEGDKHERLVINTRQLDCTTLVETVTALTLCAQNGQYSWFAYKHMLTDLRYRGGIINGYPSRLHYFTEWITDNTLAGVVTEIQSPNPPFTAVQNVRVSYMSTHPQSYQSLREHPEFVSDIAKMEARCREPSIALSPRRLWAITNCCARSSRMATSSLSPATSPDSTSPTWVLPSGVRMVCICSTHRNCTTRW